MKPLFVRVAAMKAAVLRVEAMKAAFGDDVTSS